MSAPEPGYRPVLSLTICALLLLIAFRAIAGPPESAPSADHASQNAAGAPRDVRLSDSLPQVTVGAQRAAIESQVHEFVKDILYLNNNEGPARWNSPVCPTIIGLGRDQGEFILQRLSQIARTAGIPLGGEQCKPPNLYVIASAHPAEVLHAWAKKTHWGIFGDGMPSAIDAFINTPRPVRAWYNSSQVGADGVKGTVGTPPGLSFWNGQSKFHASTFDHQQPSRMTRMVTWGLNSVIVVVDKTKVAGVTLEQLADYIGMHAFSQLKERVHHPDALTILGLFDEESEHPTPGLTTWDEAFLKSLYDTNPTLIHQPIDIVDRMVKDIVP